MSQSLWFALTWIAGTAAILGSLMALGSVLLWFVPSVPPRSRKLEEASTIPAWQNRLKLLVFSVAIALAGLGILVVTPFPSL
ncbi:hypothetical protein H6F76_08780 [Leptolyngbya sp. FACHB-321]|uniref:hypothetical protein n=1 Tax=Leptolyngbya sp. FACHB-321 TaxID=2692807 RepID=UPI001683C415|nr:hypothetical protein [Leptolyngbya sp. FACHB-321]MBD2035122.1 hypothetical protein [Leptolyngbya sp. FACHB-321]